MIDGTSNTCPACGRRSIAPSLWLAAIAAYFGAIGLLIVQKPSRLVWLVFAFLLFASTISTLAVPS
jgi:hypothetical protein